MRLSFCGVRGSTPAPGVPYHRYGGHTSCLALAATGGPVDLVLDAGTGLAAVTALLDGLPFDGTVLLTHLHWDHTHGMPFFTGGARPGSRVRVQLPAQGESAQAVLERAFSPPHFPITPAELGPGWSFDGLEAGAHDLGAWHVTALEVPHKGGRTFGYRVERDGVSVAYLSDHSPTSAGPGPDGLGERHETALALAAGADVLVHDAQHLAAEFPGVAYLGHASVEYGVALAAEAGVGTLVLFHHAPTRTDDEIDALLAHAVRVAARAPGLTVVAAREGMVLSPERRGA